jgi:hypothetical protein
MSMTFCDLVQTQVDDVIDQQDSIELGVCLNIVRDSSVCGELCCHDIKKEV